MRTILPYKENPALRKVAADIPLAEIDTPFIRELIADMKHLLAQEKYGVAIAASQVGEPLRLFVVSGRALARHADDEEYDSGTEDEKEKPIPPDASRQSKATADQVYINPVMVKMSKDKTQKHEGCLSVKGKWGNVARAQKATVRAYDEHGKLFTRGASGFLAHVFQHEMDHLDGILYIDKAKKLYDDKPDDEK